MKKLIVGLGNPGLQYKWTRHNLGFMVLEALAAQAIFATSKFSDKSEDSLPGKMNLYFPMRQAKQVWRNSASNQGMLARAVIADVDCSLLMPLTFMNNSGVSVKRLAENQGIALENILIVTDDLTLPFGKMRLRPLGSAGGHNGLKSIIQHLGSNQFARLRLGIDAPQDQADTVNYVLANFTPAEKKSLPDFINHALDCVTCWVTEGAKLAMNRFN